MCSTLRFINFFFMKWNKNSSSHNLSVTLIFDKCRIDCIVQYYMASYTQTHSCLSFQNNLFGLCLSWQIKREFKAKKKAFAHSAIHDVLPVTHLTFKFKFIHTFIRYVDGLNNFLSTSEILLYYYAVFPTNLIHIYLHIICSTVYFYFYFVLF